MIMNDEWGGTWEEAGIAHFKKTTLKFTCRQWGKPQKPSGRMAGSQSGFKAGYLSCETDAVYCANLV